MEPGQGTNDTGEQTYQSIVSTHKVMQKVISRLLSEEGLTPPQFYSLRYVAKHGPVKMRMLSEELHVTPANITRVIDRLESRGLVRRMSQSGDRRATLLGLTPKGRVLQEG